MRNPLISRAGLLTVAAGLSSLALAAPAPSPVRNGDMTQGDATPAGWTLAKPVAGVTLSRDTAVFRSAPASLRVDIAETAGAAVQQRLDGTPRDAITIQAAVKLEGAFRTVQVACQAFDPAWKQLGWLPVGSARVGDWQTIEGTVRLPPATAHALLVLALNGQGHAWLDDVSATPAASEAGAPASAPMPAALHTGSHVAADDPHIRYVGRTARRNGAVIFAWPAVEATVRFRGAGDVGVRCAESGKNRLQTVVDGVRRQAFMPGDPPVCCPVATNLPPGEHTVSVVKLTEALFGSVSLLSFELPAGAELLPVPPRTRRIEVIGDSISAGFGNEAANQHAAFMASTENADLAYGALAARRVAADYTCLAWSGKKMATNNTLPALYGRTLPQDEGSTWSFDEPQPDVELINLGTNDFANGNPDEEPWVAAYLVFLKELRGRHPNSMIYCAIGPMLSDTWSPSKTALSTIRRSITRVVADRQASGDTRVKLLEFEMQTGASGFGAQWHPSLKTHRLMAERFVQALHADLGWIPADASP